ncbi:TPA: hypothetical protein N2E80_003200, partial [Salmonella enterica]|nr:hypothetical protein [Salmonella enterica]
MSVSSCWRSSGSLVVGPRDYVKISRNRVVWLREKLRKARNIMVSGYHNAVPELAGFGFPGVAVLVA